MTFNPSASTRGGEGEAPGDAGSWGLEVEPVPQPCSVMQAVNSETSSMQDSQQRSYRSRDSAAARAKATELFI
ncbi:MAG TPA: hypothetical protein VF791_15850 [Pyrinomonadaceae bacterium]